MVEIIVTVTEGSEEVGGWFAYLVLNGVVSFGTDLIAYDELEDAVEDILTWFGELELE